MISAGRPGLRVLKVLAGLLTGAIALLLLACAIFVGMHEFQMHQMAVRAEHWNAGLKLHAAPGAMLADTRAFFASQGAALACAASRANTIQCAAHDPQSFGLLPSWRFHFTLDFSDGKLVRVHTQQLGVGL
jgi:hypothetical protein